MAKPKTKVTEGEKRGVLSFFILAFPTFIILTLMLLYPNTWLIAILLGIYQFILLKQFLDDYYKQLY